MSSDRFETLPNLNLGGETSKYFGYFSPRILGDVMNILSCAYFFRMGWGKNPTKLGMELTSCHDDQLVAWVRLWPPSKTSTEMDHFLPPRKPTNVPIFEGAISKRKVSSSHHYFSGDMLVFGGVTFLSLFEVPSLQKPPICSFFACSREGFFINV